MNTNMTGFRWFSKIFGNFIPVLWMKIASALEGHFEQNKQKDVKFSLFIVVTVFSSSVCGTNMIIYGSVINKF